MAIRKRQHFVPQFYLRNFSSRQSSSHIYLYNLKRNFCKEVPVKTQCSLNYFYSDKIEIEDAFSKLESSAALILKKIILQERLDQLTDVEYVHLMSFILLQHGRTKYSGDINLELIEYAFENFMKPMALEDKKFIDKGITKEDLDSIKITHKYPALQPALTNVESAPLIVDLQPVLLVNKAKLDFVTSDNPVIFFNSYFNGKEKQMIDGIQSKGLQILYPINSKLMLFLYDPNYYHLSFNEKLCVKVQKNKDVRRINGLHIINCDENVYFQNKKTQIIVEQQHKELGHKRPERKAEFEVYGPMKFEDKFGELHRFSRTKYTYNLNLTLINFNPDADDTPGVRNPEFLKQHKDFIKKKEQAKLRTVKDYHKFVDDYFKDVKSL